MQLAIQQSNYLPKSCQIEGPLWLSNTDNICTDLILHYTCNLFYLLNCVYRVNHFKYNYTYKQIQYM